MSLFAPIVSLILIVFLLAIVFWQSRRITALKANNGASSGGTLVLADAVSADVSSEALFATLSHELRTPLNGLLGIVQMLNEEEENEDLVAIEGCARHMLAVVSTLVNHSKIQAEWEDLPEYREWVSPYELLEQVKRYIAFRAGLR